MYKGRRAYLRMASVAASAGCLALAACSSSASSGAGSTASATGAAPAASIADPLAGMTASQVATEVMADAKAAPSLALNGTIRQKTSSETINVGIKPGQGCTGMIDDGATGTLKVTEIGTTLYVNPDKQFWETAAGSQATQIINLVGGKYLSVPSDDKDFGTTVAICDVSKMFDTNGKLDTLTKGKVTTLNGTRVLAINDKTDGSVFEVTDTGKPQVVAITAAGGGKTGTINVTYGSPVTLTVPASSDVMAGSQLGL